MAGRKLIQLTTAPDRCQCLSETDGASQS